MMRTRVAWAAVCLAIIAMAQLAPANTDTVPRTAERRIAISELSPTALEAVQKQLILELNQTTDAAERQRLAEDNKTVINEQLRRKGNLAEVKRVLRLALGDHYLSEAIENGEIVRWNKTTLYVCLSNIDALNNKTPRYLDATIRAIAKTQKALGRILEIELTDDRDSADILIEWYPQLSDGDTDITVSGKTEVTQVAQTLLWADIKIATQTKEGRLFTPPEMACIVSHEILHALGIAGHSPNPNDLMFYKYNPAKPESQLSPADITTLRLLYRLAPTITDRTNLDRPDSKRYQDAIITGKKLEDSAKNGLPSLLAAYELNPEDPTLQFLIGTALFQRREFIKALPFLETAAKGNTRVAEFSANLGLCLLQYVINGHCETTGQINRYIDRARVAFAAAAEAPQTTDQVRAVLRTRDVLLRQAKQGMPTSKATAAKEKPTS